MSEKHRPLGQEAPSELGICPETAQSKRPFVPPRLTRHGSLPEVTTQFIGEFSA